MGGYMNFDKAFEIIYIYIYMEPVKDAMGAETVAAHEAAVAQQIADQKNPPVVSPKLPWTV